MSSESIKIIPTAKKMYPEEIQAAINTHNKALNQLTRKIRHQTYNISGAIAVETIDKIYGILAHIETRQSRIRELEEFLEQHDAS